MQKIKWDYVWNIICLKWIINFCMTSKVPCQHFLWKHRIQLSKRLNHQTSTGHQQTLQYIELINYFKNGITSLQSQCHIFSTEMFNSFEHQKSFQSSLSIISTYWVTLWIRLRKVFKSMKFHFARNTNGIYERAN